MPAIHILVLLFLLQLVLSELPRHDDPLRAIKDDDPTKVAYFWHISDPHVDLDYKIGSHGNCPWVICCRDSTGNYSKEDAAGKFGFIKNGQSSCDLPLETFKTALDFIKSYPINPEFVFYGGDSPSHADWEYSKEYNLKYMNVLHDTMRESLGSSILLLSAIGNHDTYPIDQFDAGPRFSWYMEPFAQQMSFWLPKQVTNQMKIAGHYNHLIRPGLRALVINTQYADVLNFYNYKNSSNPDPGALVSTTRQWLSEAEQAGEKVLLLGHIPPQATEPWNKALLQLSKQYSKTILGQMYGHNHKDKIHIARDEHGAYSVAYVVSALTTFSNQFPAVRLFKMDKNTFELLDHVNFYGNVTEANISGEMKYKFEYSAKETYELKDMSATSWNKVVEDFLVPNSTFVKKYIDYYHSLGSLGTPHAICNPNDVKCVRKLYCDASNFSEDGKRDCVRK
ncbi:sphingomyelin phosphodiesterase A [Acrasis kona]|uniref:Sphingomyelin phosphodiesterase A n=1 Tax=Acrasis kona TaxID=1008807 RepID=A0AAW2ZR44_9EUKA